MTKCCSCHCNKEINIETHLLASTVIVFYIFEYSSPGKRCSPETSHFSGGRRRNDEGRGFNLGVLLIILEKALLLWGYVVTVWKYFQIESKVKSMRINVQPFLELWDWQDCSQRLKDSVGRELMPVRSATRMWQTVVTLKHGVMEVKVWTFFKVQNQWDLTSVSSLRCVEVMSSSKQE